MTPEGKLMREQQLLATKLGARVFRNNVGRAVTETGYAMTFGLGVGSSDLIGWTADGRFLALEVKVRARVTPEQRAFIAAVRSAGGLGGVTRGDEDTRAILAGEIRD